MAVVGGLPVRSILLAAAAKMSNNHAMMHPCMKGFGCRPVCCEGDSHAMVCG